jgi:hypothetical protein
MDVLASKRIYAAVRDEVVLFMLPLGCKYLDFEI